MKKNNLIYIREHKLITHAKLWVRFQVKFLPKKTLC
jgi:hypothetical protein